MDMPETISAPTPAAGIPAAATQPFPKDNAKQNLLLWKKRFAKKPISSNPAIVTLDVEYNELVQSWKTFQEHLPMQFRVKFQERPQGAGDVVELVRGVQTTWMASPRQRWFSQSMDLSNHFIISLDTHSALLATLSGSEIYFSLFYGVLQTVIRASANYPRVIEALLQALIGINEAIRLPFTAKQYQLPPGLFHAVVRFYSITFFFLEQFMNWYTRLSHCQLLSSENVRMENDFQSLLLHIRESACHITGVSQAVMDLENISISPGTASHFWHEAQLRPIGLQALDRKSALQNVMIRQLVWEIQRDAEERLVLRREAQMLLSNTSCLLSERLHPIEDHNSNAVCILTAAADAYVVSETEWSHASRRKLTRTNLQFASGHLQPFIESGYYQATDADSNQLYFIERNVLKSLKQWIVSPHSQVLAVGNVTPSTAAAISASYLCCARQTKVPIVSYVCSLSPTAADGMTVYEHALVVLSYSLIRQLIDLLPPVLDCDASCNFLDAERFRRFDGTLKSWKEVLSLLNTLLKFAPPLLLCTIYGFDVLQDASTDQYMRSLVRVLLAHTNRSLATSTDQKEQSLIFKILFTAAGPEQAPSLVEALSETHQPVFLPSDAGKSMDCAE